MAGGVLNQDSDNQDKIIKGATDGTQIGNVNDSLKVYTTLNGSVSTAPVDFFLGVNRSIYTGYTTVGKFGVNQSLGNSSFETIWAASTAYTFAASAAPLAIVSTSANDTNSSGTGLRTIRVEGLDGSFEPVSETVNLNGTTTVNTSNSYRFVNRVIGVTAGTGKTNAGDITVQNGGTTIAYIQAGVGITQQLVYTVPENNNLYIYEWGVQVGNGKSTESSLVVTDHDNSIETNRESLEHSESFVIPITPLLVVPERNSVRIIAKASTGSHRVSGFIHAVLVDEDIATI